MKMWTEAECRELIDVIFKRYDIDDVAVDVRKRRKMGVYTCVRTTDPRPAVPIVTYDKKVIRLARWLFSGNYGKWKMETSPTKRLIVVLHECAHAVLHKVNLDAFVTQPSHGQAFRNLERLLIGEHGWRPIYPDGAVKGYPTHYVNTDDASEINIRNCNPTLRRS